ncbi:MAG: hypothetical protein PHF74_02405 [Dehalococcoidales bacterium]|nr:hypothetical protein [Dehalococcoidales bacterium]
MSGKNNEAANLKRTIRKIRQDEKDALAKAQYDARLAISKAAETRELELVLARETEMRTLRDMQQSFDSSIKAIREANKNNLDEIKKTRADAVTEARNLENRITREAYDEEAAKISGADRKTIQKIKYDTLKKIRLARYNTERAIKEALFEEKHATRKALDIAYRDIVKEEELQKRTMSRTIIDARNVHLKAINDADLRYRNTVDEIQKNYIQNTAAIRKQAREDIINLKNGSRLPEREELSSTVMLEEKQEKSAATSLKEYDSQEIEELTLPDKPALEAETATFKDSDDDLEPFTEESIATEEPEMQEQSDKAVDIDKQPEPVEIPETDEVVSVEEKPASILSVEDNESATGDIRASETESENMGATLYSEIVRITIKSPTESHRIKLLGDQLNNIDKVRMLFISGEVNRDTIIHVKLDEEIPLADILKKLPDVADVSVKNKNIQLTLKSDK